jgi:large subunit ribosomal protein L24
LSGTRIRKGDRVEVLTGKYRGVQGKVLKNFPEKERVIVEGVNIVKKHSRPSQENPQGGIMHREAPIHVSNVALVCDSCNNTIRVGYRLDSEGNKRRVCRRCGADLE